MSTLLDPLRRLKRALEAVLDRRAARGRVAELARTRPVVTKAAITEGLAGLGVAEGDILFVHSSLKSLGFVEGGPRALIEALLAAVGPSGTLLLPTYYLPGGTILGTCRLEGYVFDVRSAGSNLGALPEAFLAFEGHTRSVHPTHSVSALGARAAEMVANHHRAPSVFGPGSPWERLIALDGKVLGLGVSTGPITFYHALEDRMGDAFPEDLWMDETFQMPCIDHAGNPVRVPVRPYREEPVGRRIDHRSRDDLRALMLAKLRATGLLREARVGEAQSWLMPAQGFITALEAMAADGITIYTPPERVAQFMAEHRPELPQDRPRG